MMPYGVTFTGDTSPAAAAGCGADGGCAEAPAVVVPCWAHAVVETRHRPAATMATGSRGNQHTLGMNSLLDLNLALSTSTFNIHFRHTSPLPARARLVMTAVDQQNEKRATRVKGGVSPPRRATLAARLARRPATVATPLRPSPPASGPATGPATRFETRHPPRRDPRGT